MTAERFASRHEGVLQGPPQSLCGWVIPVFFGGGQVGGVGGIVTGVCGGTTCCCEQCGYQQTTVTKSADCFHMTCLSDNTFLDQIRD